MDEMKKITEVLVEENIALNENCTEQVNSNKRYSERMMAYFERLSENK